MNDNQYFILFSNCITVEGHIEAAICDVQYGSIIKVPKMLIRVLNQLATINKKSFSLHFDIETVEVLHKYIAYLEQEEFGFWTSNPEWFPKISEECDFPSKVTNAILEIGDDMLGIENIFHQLNDFNCKSVEIRILNEKLPLANIETILDASKNSGIQSIYLNINKLCEKISADDLVGLIHKNPRIYSICCFASSLDRAC